LITAFYGVLINDYIELYRSIKTDHPKYPNISNCYSILALEEKLAILTENIKG